MPIPIAHAAARRRAFTVVELLVVASILLLLIAILLPAMNRSRESARRAACSSNQRQIVIGQITYAGSNFGDFISCKGRRSTVVIAPKGYKDKKDGHPDDYRVDWIQALKDVNLMKGPKIDSGINKSGIDRMQWRPGDVLYCPSRDFDPDRDSQYGGWEPGPTQLVIGYRNFGGIEYWKNPWVGKIASRSPVNVFKSKPMWVLNADTTGKIDGKWGGGRVTAHKNMPAHKAWDDNHAAGGNQAHVDGSVAWYHLNEMVYAHSWAGNYTRMYYIYQKDTGEWNPPADAYGDAALD